jgi:hypothetical protein
VRSIVCWMLCLCCAPAAAAVSCDQLGAIALATEQFRSQGESLPAILAEADKLEAGNGFSKADMASIRQTVQLTFERTRTALEIRQECRDPPAR